MSDRNPLEAYRGVPVLLLGATGFVGRWVARALAEAGAELHLTAREPAGLEGLSGREHRVDLEAPGAVAALCADLRPAVAFNLAGYGVDPAERDESRARALNRDLPAALAGSLVEHAAAGWPGRVLVQAGSALEYGPVEGPITESLPSRPDTQYGCSKWEGAQAIAAVVEESGLRAVEGRIFTAYGPGEHAGRLLPTLLEARGHDRPLELTDGRQPRDFVYVADVAEALLRLAACPLPGYDQVNVATGQLHSVRRFVEISADVLGISPERLHFGARRHLREEMWHGPVSVERLRQQTGWSPSTTPRQGVAATLEEEASRT